jgi:hypothetical protein
MRTETNRPVWGRSMREARIIGKTSNLTFHTTASAQVGEETLTEKVAVAAAFVLCTVMTLAVGFVL